MTPPEMTDEQIDNIDQSMCGDRECHLPFAQAIIAARDKQWTEMLGGPVAWQWVDVDGLTKTIRMNPHIEHATPLYAPKQEKPVSVIGKAITESEMEPHDQNWKHGEEL